MSWCPDSVLVLADPPPSAHGPGSVRATRRPGGDRTGVAVGAEVLARVEAGRGDVAEAPADPVVRGALGLRGVLDDADAAGQRRRADLVDRGALAVEVDRDHRAGPVGEGLVDGVGVEQVVVVAVDQDQRRPDADDGLGGGDERVGRHHHLVTGADTDAAQRDLERVGPVADADAVVDADGNRRTSLSNSATSRPPMNDVSPRTGRSRSATSSAISRCCQPQVHQGDVAHGRSITSGRCASSLRADASDGCRVSIPVAGQRSHTRVPRVAQESCPNRSRV